MKTGIKPRRLLLLFIGIVVAILIGFGWYTQNADTTTHFDEMRLIPEESTTEAQRVSKAYEFIPFAKYLFS